MQLRVVLLVASVMFAAVAACTLNPQPLPPGDEPSTGPSSSSGGFGGSRDDESGQATTAPPFPAPDAGIADKDKDGGDAATDGGGDDGSVSDASDDGG